MRKVSRSYNKWRYAPPPAPLPRPPKIEAQPISLIIFQMMVSGGVGSGEGDTKIEEKKIKKGNINVLF